MIKVTLIFKSEGAEKNRVLSQGTGNSINLRYESLINVDYNCKEIPALLSWM